MPNWVFSDLTITGEGAKKFFEDSSQDYTIGYEGIESRPETHAMPIYEPSNDEFSFYALVRPETEAEQLDYATGGWYDWNVKHWGTKWDAGDVEIYEVTDDKVTIKFQTAWSPPFEWLDKVTKMYPHLKFQFDYEEETGWGGSRTYREGRVVRETQYEEEVWEEDND